MQSSVNLELRKASISLQNFSPTVAYMRSVPRTRRRPRTDHEWLNGPETLKVKRAVYQNKGMQTICGPGTLGKFSDNASGNPYIPSEAA
jgi:hypothetical protein